MASPAPAQRVVVLLTTLLVGVLGIGLVTAVGRQGDDDARPGARRPATTSAPPPRGTLPGSPPIVGDPVTEPTPGSDDPGTDDPGTDDDPDDGSDGTDGDGSGSDGSGAGADGSGSGGDDDGSDEDLPSMPDTGAPGALAAVAAAAASGAVLTRRLAR